MSDPNFANVGLLLHCNGTDASTTFTDSSNNAHTVTPAGNAQIDTAQKKYGTGSALFDGTGDRLSVAHSSTFDVASGDFTVECWLRVNAGLDGIFTIAAQVAGAGQQWRLYFEEGTLFFFGDSNATPQIFVCSALVSGWTTGVWYHIAGTRAGNTFRLFVDGTLEDAISSSATLKTSAEALTIADYSTAGETLDGWVDDFRLTKGLARYTASFTPPTAEFEEGAFSGYVSAPSPLGAGAVLGTVGQINGRIAAPSPLGAARLRAFHDWTPLLVALQPVQFVCDLITPDGDVRAPISSWQATLTTDGECYAGCVIPGALAWTETLEDTTMFVISRRAELSGGVVIFVPLIRCPLQTLQIDMGPTNVTASISGYFAEIAEDDAPTAIYDRTVFGVRSVTTYDTGQRLRCEMEWLLRPGQRALYGNAQSMIVDYMNFYATAEGSAVQAYMDIGERD